MDLHVGILLDKNMKNRIMNTSASFVHVPLPLPSARKPSLPLYCMTHFTRRIPKIVTHPHRILPIIMMIDPWDPQSKHPPSQRHRPFLNRDHLITLPTILFHGENLPSFRINTDTRPCLVSKPASFLHF